MSFILSLLLAAGSLPLISGAPLAYSPSRASADAVEVEQATSSHSLNGRSTNLYHAVFGGNGLVSNGWPAMSSWISSFDDMFENNKAIMGSSCSQWGVADTTEAEMATIKSAITNVASESGVDARFILAIVMQESNGCVRVPTTNYGVVNPGLMQSHNGKGTCNTGSGTAPQNVQSPCPESEIEQMIRDGTMGTADGDGLKQLIEQNGGTSDVTAFYKAARCYNSGSIAANGNLGDGIATHCYASDVANRLLGWSSGTSDCNDNTISSLSGSISSGSSSSGSSGSSSSSTTTSSTKPTAVSTILPQSTTPTSTATSTTTTSSTVHTTSTPVGAVQTPVAQTTPAATTSTTPAPSATASASTLDAPLYPYAISPCQEHYTVVAGDYCQKVEVQFGITAAQLQSWNPGLDESCSNLWKGYRYCVKA